MHTNGSPLLVAQRPNSKAGPARSAVGFLLLDSLLRPISFNAEALQILSYPDTLTNARRPDVFLAGKIRERLLSPQPSRESPLATEFQSGRRRYLCRAFPVDSNGQGPSHASIAVLLERVPFGVMPLSPVSEQFNLTRRERDALESLLQGLSNKEIASRMGVSPNTVKAFLRLIMLKMEVSSRAAIVAKIMMITP
jgi:DNA-binding CsgD family transcriptional regulator